MIIPLGKVNDSAGNASEASNYLTLKYDNNIYVDSFDSLDTWTNSSQSSSNQGWYIVDDGSSGKGARSDVSGFGFGDKLSKEFDFTADVWITLKVKKLSGYSIRAYLKSNENTLWTFGSSGDPVDAFVEKKAFVSKGKQIISIETDYSGSLWIDDLKIETVTNPLVTISSFFTSPTNSNRIPIDVTFTNPVTGFDEDDIVIGNADISDFSGTLMNYSFVVSPLQEGDISIMIPENVVEDENNEGNKASKEFTIIYDISNPQPQLSWDLVDATNNKALFANLEFDEVINNLLESDFELVNCMIDSIKGKDTLFQVYF